MGDKAGLTPDCTTGETRDVASLSLPGVQEELVLAVAATGTPVVLVLVAGRPIGSPAVHAAARAVLHAWLPGEAGADAIADALTGAVNPGGKLPVSYPRSSGQIPVFYGHKVSGGRSFWRGEYVDMSNRPLYPFGFGLSYTTFELAPAPLDEPIVTTGDTIGVTVTVRNTGATRGDEVVQLYTRDPVASVTRPVLELQAFARVSLDPGGQATVEFDLAVADLGFHDRSGRYVVEAGEIDVYVGTSATDISPVGTVTVKGDPAVVAQRTFANVAHASSSARSALPSTAIVRAVVPGIRSKAWGSGDSGERATRAAARPHPGGIDAVVGAPRPASVRPASAAPATHRTAVGRSTRDDPSGVATHPP